MDLYDHGTQKYGAADILHSSLSCEWSGIAAELRYHPAGELPPVDLIQTEIGVATRCHRDSVVSRRGNGRRQITRVVPGTIWTCSAGVREEEIVLSKWHECLHIYLPSSRFVEVSEIRGGAPVHAHQIRYLADLHDPLIRQIGWTLLAELQAPTSAGRVLAETLALSLTARLTQAYTEECLPGVNPIETRHKLDDVRLARVIEFLAQHLERDVSIDHLAAVACLSPFHFIRMFRNRMGIPPNRYLSKMRLELAKSLLTASEVPLCEIGLRCCFSSQSNFTRAFQRAMGMTPGTYRRSFYRPGRRGTPDSES